MQKFLCLRANLQEGGAYIKEGAVGLQLSFDEDGKLQPVILLADSHSLFHNYLYVEQDERVGRGKRISPFCIIRCNFGW